MSDGAEPRIKYVGGAAREMTTERLPGASYYNAAPSTRHRRDETFIAILIRENHSGILICALY